MRVNEEEISFLTKKQMEYAAFMWVLRGRGQGQKEKKERESGELQHRKQKTKQSTFPSPASQTGMPPLPASS